MALNQSVEGGEGVNPAEIMRKNVPDQGNSKCKGMKAEMFVGLSGNSQKANVNTAAKATRDSRRGEK